MEIVTTWLSVFIVRNECINTHLLYIFWIEVNFQNRLYLQHIRIHFGVIIKQLNGNIAPVAQV